jgi:hypothetical protein
MSFSDTAAYFEARAKTTRSDERRNGLAEAGKFYRQLATITSTFPIGYKRPPDFACASDRLDKRAQECIALAEAMHDPACKDKMMRLARTYEQISRSLAE